MNRMLCQSLVHHFDNNNISENCRHKIWFGCVIKHAFCASHTRTQQNENERVDHKVQLEWFDKYIYNNILTFVLITCLLQLFRGETRIALEGRLFLWCAREQKESCCCCFVRFLDLFVCSFHFCFLFRSVLETKFFFPSGFVCKKNTWFYAFWIDS